MNPDLNNLQPYPFEKLRDLKAGATPPADKAPIMLSIGEPKHPAPALVLDTLRQNLSGLENYPLTKGTLELRQAIAAWLSRRFHLAPHSVDPERHIIPVNGTREALFAFAQACIDRTSQPVVMMPNPFYQIYEGAALLAGAQPWFLNCTEENNFKPDLNQVPESAWRRCQLLYLCSPGNPIGAVYSQAELQEVLRLAEKYDFIVASDECYSEIYFDEQQPPPGLLQAAATMGNDSFQRCVVFHSLSKRSNLPGMRSGFVAGDAKILERFLLYRTYHGCAMAPPVQLASIAAWNDEQHVRENRDLYRRKFQQVIDILNPVMPVAWPDAGFYLWPRTPQADTDFTRNLFAAQNVTVLPGRYLSRDNSGHNPGHGRVRMALVASVEECVEAARRIRHFIEQRT